MASFCDFCGLPFSGGADHGCAESRPTSDLVERLREDHRDTVECEHGFLLHRDPCPNVVCLGRDLYEAAAELEKLRAIATGGETAMNALGRTQSLITRQVAQLRHAYEMLAKNSVRDQKMLADNLIAPIIRILENFDEGEQ